MEEKIFETYASYRQNPRGRTGTAAGAGARQCAAGAILENVRAVLSGSVRKRSYGIRNDKGIV